MGPVIQRAIAYCLRQLLVRVPWRRLSVALAYRLPRVFQTEIRGVAACRFGPIFAGFDLRDIIQRVLFLAGCYEPRETAFIVQSLRPGATFVDVGANIGYYSLIASKAVGPSGCVIAVEPVESNVRKILANITLNAATNIEVIPVAAAATTGEFSFSSRQEEHQTGWGSLDAGGDVRVSGKRLDEILQERDLTNVDILKIDVEGNEPDVLAGAAGLLSSKRFCGPIVLEINHERLAGRGYSERDVRQLLHEYGFVESTRCYFPPEPAESPLRTCIFERY